MSSEAPCISCESRATPNTRKARYLHENQYLVLTPYGRGRVLRSRPTDSFQSILIREIELIDWKVLGGHTEPLESGRRKPAVLFSCQDFPSIEAEVGSEVLTLWGRGRVTEVRVETGHVVVRSSSWRLSGRSKVLCYVHSSAVKVVQPKKTYEMTVYERVEFAQDLKERAAEQFKAKEYAAALVTYAEAIDAVRYVQHQADSCNEVRGDLLLVMIACSNNAATCSARLGKWEEVVRFARNALLLIDALEGKKGGKIHSILVREGCPDAKIFGEWKVKSLILVARGLAETQEFDDAIVALKRARDVIGQYTVDDTYSDARSAAAVKQMRLSDKELRRLFASYKEMRKSQLSKERQRARAMFCLPNTTPDAEKKGIATEDDGNVGEPLECQNSLLCQLLSEQAYPPSAITTDDIEKKALFTDDMDRDCSPDPGVQTRLVPPAVVAVVACGIVLGYVLCRGRRC